MGGRPADCSIYAPRLRDFPNALDPTTGKQEPGTGTLEAMADTLQDALARARGLRTQGFAVSITGPDGEPIPEMDEGTGAAPKGDA